MKKKIKFLIGCLLLISMIITPMIANATQFEDASTVSLEGTFTFNNATKHFEYDHGDVTITKDSVAVTSSSFSVAVGNVIAVTLLPDENYTPRLNGGSDNHEITLTNNSYQFTIGNANSDTLTLTPSFGTGSLPEGNDDVEIPANSIQLKLWDNLGNAMSYDIIKNDNEFLKAQAVFNYSYDNTTWYEISNFTNDANLTEAHNTIDGYTYAFTNVSKVYVKLVSIQKGKFQSYLEEKFNNENERVIGDVVVGKTYELTIKNVPYGFEYNNGFFSVDWTYNDPNAPADMNVTNGTAKIIKIDDEDVSLSDGNTSTGGYWRISQNSIVTIELKPNYGYQLSAAGFNGFALVSGANVNQFTFTMAGANLHFAALFVATNDVMNVSGNSVSAAAVAGAGNVVDTGNVKLNVSDLNVTEEMRANFEEQAGEDEILSFIDLELSNIVYKTANGTQVWEHQLSELDEEITVILTLKNALSNKSGMYYLIREHNGIYEKLSATYNAKKNTLTFKTDKFSEYAIALKPEAANPKTNDTIMSTIAIATAALVGLIGTSLYIKKKKYI